MLLLYAYQSLPSDLFGQSLEFISSPTVTLLISTGVVFADELAKLVYEYICPSFALYKSKLYVFAFHAAYKVLSLNLGVVAIAKLVSPVEPAFSALVSLSYHPRKV